MPATPMDQDQDPKAAFPRLARFPARRLKRAHSHISSAKASEDQAGDSQKKRQASEDQAGDSQKKRHYESPLQAEARAFGLDVDTHLMAAELVDTLKTPRFDHATACQQLHALLDALLPEASEPEASESVEPEAVPEAGSCPVEQAELLVLRALLKTAQHNATLTKTVARLAVDTIRKHTAEIQSSIDAISNAETIPDLEDIEDVRAFNKKIQLALDDLLV